MFTYEEVFLTGEKASLQTVLSGKEKRVERIYDYLSNNKEATLISLKCNIPGAVKNNEAIKKLNAYGKTRVEDILQKQNVNIEKFEFFDEITGPESIYLLTDVSPIDVKKMMIDFEEESLGRLFDADVHYFENNAVCSNSRTQLGFDLRACYICNQPAKICAGRRVHPLEEIQNKIVEILNVEGKEL